MCIPKKFNDNGVVIADTGADFEANINDIEKLEVACDRCFIFDGYQIDKKMMLNDANFSGLLTFMKRG